MDVLITQYPGGNFKLKINGDGIDTSYNKEYLKLLAVRMYGAVYDKIRVVPYLPACIKATCPMVLPRREV